MKKIFIVLILSFAITEGKTFGQIEVDHLKVRDYNKTSFGGFLNFSIPKGESDYYTMEFGIQYFDDESGDYLGLIPVIFGYRYTLNRTGYGLYIEPDAGYSFGGSTFTNHDQYGNSTTEIRPAGPTAGISFGYLLSLSGVNFDFAVKYQRGFGKDPTNVFSFRLSHSFSFRRKNRSSR